MGIQNLPNQKASNKKSKNQGNQNAIVDSGDKKADKSRHLLRLFEQDLDSLANEIILNKEYKEDVREKKKRNANTLKSFSSLHGPIDQTITKESQD
jgi:hypothetical protein